MVGDQEVNLSIPDQDVIIDSGTSFFYMPTPEFNAFYSKLEQASAKCFKIDGKYTDRFCSCNSTKDEHFPVIQMNIG